MKKYYFLSLGVLLEGVLRLLGDVMIDSGRTPLFFAWANKVKGMQFKVEKH